MKLSTKGRYGLRALIDLAQYSEIEPVSISSIAGASGDFGTLFGAADGEIKEGRLIKSIRGAGGGYVLAREVESISVGDVLRALEGNLEPVECSGLHPEEGCEAAGGCVTKYVWQKINEVLIRRWMRSSLTVW